jgi:hypothetical protein
MKQRAQNGETLPLAPAEFTTDASIARALVEEWFSTGRIETVNLGPSVRIPLSVMSSS